MKHSFNINSVRFPPPSYQLSTSNVEHSRSKLTSVNSSSTSSQQSTTNINNPSSGFDREFSRLLYGKDTRKNQIALQKKFEY